MLKAGGNRVKVGTATTGTGTVTYGTASTGYQLPPTKLNGKRVRYTIEEPAVNPTDFEVGYGVIDTSGKTLTRDKVTSSSNGGALVNLTSGASAIILTLAYEDLVPQAMFMHTMYGGM